MQESKQLRGDRLPHRAALLKPWWNKRKMVLPLNDGQSKELHQGAAGPLEKTLTKKVQAAYDPDGLEVQCDRTAQGLSQKA